MAGEFRGFDPYSYYKDNIISDRPTNRRATMKKPTKRSTNKPSSAFVRNYTIKTALDASESLALSLKSAVSQLTGPGGENQSMEKLIGLAFSIVGRASATLDAVAAARKLV